MKTIKKRDENTHNVLMNLNNNMGMNQDNNIC